MSAASVRPRVCPESRRGPARVGPGEELCLDVWVCLYEYTMDMASQTSDLSLSDETFFAEVGHTDLRDPKESTDHSKAVPYGTCTPPPARVQPSHQVPT